MAFNADGDGVNGIGSPCRRIVLVRSARVRRGPPRAWYACRESVRNLGGPMGSTAETQLRNDLAQGKRLLSHERGNPDTEAGRSLDGENASSDASGGKRVRPKEEAPKIRGESDPLIVLGDGRADHKGKGRTEVRSWYRKHCPARKGRGSNANLTAGNSKEGTGKEGPPVLQPLPVDRRGSPAGLLARHPQKRRVRRGWDQRRGIRGEPDRQHPGSSRPAEEEDLPGKTGGSIAGVSAAATRGRVSRPGANWMLCLFLSEPVLSLLLKSSFLTNRWSRPVIGSHFGQIQ